LIIRLDGGVIEVEVKAKVEVEFEYGVHQMGVRGKPGGLRGQLIKDVDEVVSKVSSVAQMYSIVFFGSTARGDVKEFSDVDLLLVCSNVPEARKVVHLLNHRFEISIHSPEELASMAKLGLPLIHHLAREGAVMTDDGSYKAAIENLRDTNMDTLKAVSADVHEALKVYLILSRFGLPYVAHVFGPLLNLVETYLCMRKIFIFNKEGVIKKLIELHPELSSLQNYMLELLSVYRNYTRFGLQEDIDLKKFIKTVKEILKAVEGDLPREG